MTQKTGTNLILSKKKRDKFEKKEEKLLTLVTIAIQNESENFTIKWNFHTSEHFKMTLRQYFRKETLFLNSSFLRSADW